MSAVLNQRMSVEEFLAWSEGQEGRYELEDGAVVAMAPERLLHTETKGEVFAALRAGKRVKRKVKTRVTRTIAATSNGSVLAGSSVR